MTPNFDLWPWAVNLTHILGYLRWTTLSNSQVKHQFVRTLSHRHTQQQTDCITRTTKVVVNNNINRNKYVRLRGQPYIHTCRSYVHTPRDIDQHAITVALPTVNFTSGWVADSSDLGLLVEKSPPKWWEIPCPGRPWATVQNLTPLALSSAEKSVTVQTNKTNSNRYIRTLPMGMCGQ